MDFLTQPQRMVDDEALSKPVAQFVKQCQNKTDDERRLECMVDRHVKTNQCFMLTRTTRHRHPGVLAT